jgi:hypothetical protein
MANLSELVTAPAIAAYWETLQSNTIPFLGPSLFPAKRMSGLKLEWLRGKDSLPVQLAPSAFDTKPTLRDRGGVTKAGIKLPFFRESMRIGEEDRQELLTLLNANAPYVDDVVSRIFDDATSLINGALINPEVEIFQLLQSAKINIASADDSGQVVNYSYNYDPNGTWSTNNATTLTGDAVWGGASQHPVADILAIKRNAAAHGVMLTRAIVSPTLWATLLTDTNIGKDVFPLATNAALSDAELQTYLSNKTGIAFTVYAKQYYDTNKVAHSFMDDDKVVFLPSTSVGSTYYGTTPEEVDLRGGAVAGAQVAIVNTGVAVLTLKEALPVNVITSVSEIVAPSYEGIDNVYVLKVK